MTTLAFFKPLAEGVLRIIDDLESLCVLVLGALDDLAVATGVDLLLRLPLDAGEGALLAA